MRYVCRGSLLALLFALAACGSAATSQPKGDAPNGQKLFSGEIAFANEAPSCAGCHAVVPGGEATIGTNLSNIGNRAATTVPGQSAEEYLRVAIVEPDAYLAGGFQEGIHYRGYGEVLTQAQLDDLIAYMLTLRSGQD